MLNEEKTDLFIWLNQEPLESDLMYKNGASYIPIDIIKSKLDFLDPEWSTSNFKHFFIQTLDGNLRVSGSVELSIKYVFKKGEYNKIISRTIVGSTTFNTADYEADGNTHFGETCLSLAIVSAAKNIAPFFGKNLNKKSAEEAAVVHDKIQETFKKLTSHDNMA